MLLINQTRHQEQTNTITIYVKACGKSAHKIIVCVNFDWKSWSFYILTIIQHEIEQSTRFLICAIYFTVKDAIGIFNVKMIWW